jgi:heme/copper-type cytochrome/quinol oxidase subunit 2
MRPHSPTIGRIYALAATIALLTTACASTSPDSNGAPTASLDDTSSVDQPTAQLVEITVEDGSVTGDIDRIDVPLGDQLTIRLTADIEDQLHVHGYEILSDVSPGQLSETTFTTNIPGIFEIHLEDLGIELARLQVS